MIFVIFAGKHKVQTFVLNYRKSYNPTNKFYYFCFYSKKRVKCIISELT